MLDFYASPQVFDLILTSKGLEGIKNRKAVKNDSFSVKVPRAGIEPARPKAQDFESSASTSSATEAYWNWWVQR